MTTQRITPTDEQAHALDLFRTGDSIGLEAGAGTGKTSTLLLLADDLVRQRRRGVYVAYNAAIVRDSAAKMPRGVSAFTAHSLAFRATGRRFRARLDNSTRMRGQEVARILGVTDYVVAYGSQRKRLAPEFVAGSTIGSRSRRCRGS